MASNLSRRTSQALNESRILVLGTQVLVGAQFLACFQAEITHLTPASRAAIVLGLAPFLLAFALFVTPTAYQQIVEIGRAHV